MTVGLALPLTIAFAWLSVSSEADRGSAEAAGTIPAIPVVSTGPVEAITTATAIPTIAQGYRSTADSGRQTRPLGEPAMRHPVDPGLRVQVRAVGGPLHVDGVGARGLAPQISEDLPQGSSVLVLRGGIEGLPPAVIRLLHAGKSLTATIGTRPNRHFDRIRCGNRDVGKSSAANLPIDGELHCLLQADEGTIEFALVVVRR